MDMQIVSLNMAGWNWRLSKETWNDRLERICEYIKSKSSNPFLIGFQECQLSGGRYKKVLEKHFPDYYIVLPKGYNNQPKSVISILLINKSFCSSYSLMELDNLEKNLRYNYVNINTHVEGLCFRILNTNIPHTCYKKSAEWFQEERRELRETFIKDIKELAQTYCNEQKLNFICLGDYNSHPEDPFIEFLAYNDDKPMMDAIKPADKNKVTWYNNVIKSKNRLDYIFYSLSMLKNTGLSAKFTIIDDTTITAKMSDHVALIGGVSYDLLDRKCFDNIK
ncbi:MAG: hypothetical protein HDR12_15655 [Lachnospiraceae bacterium]|nr:hypothetical protein [Lachnospiraceae bacterium]